MFRQLSSGEGPEKQAGWAAAGWDCSGSSGRSRLCCGAAAPEKAPAVEVPEQTGAAETIELKLAHFWPSAHQIETQFVPAGKVIEGN